MASSDATEPARDAPDPGAPQAVSATHPTPRWLDWLGRAEIFVGSVALTVLTVMVLIQAAQRYGPWKGLPFTGELARFCLVWLTFSVIGVLLTRDEHITLRLIDMVPNRRLLTVVHVFALVTLAAIGVGGFIEGYNLMDVQARLKSPSMEMPMAWLYAIPMVGFASLTVRSLIATFYTLRYGPKTAVLTEPEAGGETVVFE